MPAHVISRVLRPHASQRASSQRANPPANQLVFVLVCWRGSVPGAKPAVQQRAANPRLVNRKPASQPAKSHASQPANPLASRYVKSPLVAVVFWLVCVLAVLSLNAAPPRQLRLPSSPQLHRLKPLPRLPNRLQLRLRRSEFLPKCLFLSQDLSKV